MTISSTTPRGAFEKMKTGAIYLDVRTEGEFNQGHPKDAVNVPVIFITAHGREANPEFVDQVKEKFPDMNTQFICGCATGKRSMIACELLENAGYTHLTNCEGSWNGTPECRGWKEEGLPVG